MNRRWVAFLAVVVVGSAVAGTTVFVQSSNADEPRSLAPQKTAELAVRSISSTEKFDGTLQFEGSTTVGVEARGVVTKTRVVGDVVEQGGALGWIDNKPVTLLYGELPQWRSLESGMQDGPDVRQLERALVDLGYAKGLGLTVDNSFTSATQVAVKRMQDALGLAEDGIIDKGEIVFLPGSARITGVTSKTGESVGASLVEVSSTKRVVKVDLAVAKRGRLAVGQSVTVKLPDGTSAQAVVRSVATAVDAGKEGAETLAVIVDLGDANVALEDAAVDVEAKTVLATDVLTAPVSALLAQAGGGYAVERIGDAGSETIPVELGAFGNGFVEVRGDVRVGDRVVVAS
jgi:peptidoglycan hydrolase-like protein with peptidoglycan-binding domain